MQFDKKIRGSGIHKYFYILLISCQKKLNKIWGGNGAAMRTGYIGLRIFKRIILIR